MAIYLIHLFSVPVWYFILKILLRVKNADQKVVTIVCIQSVLLMGLRSLEIGTDTITYSWIFENCANLSFAGLLDYHIEFGYSLLNKVVAVLFSEYRVMMFVNAIIIMLGIRNVILKLSDNKIMSIYLFIAIGYFCSAMNIVRQYIALVFVLNAFVAVLYKQKAWKWKILLNCLIATLFHMSAILMLAVIIGYYIIYNEKIKKGFMLRMIACLVGGVLVLFLNKIIQMIPFVDYDYLVHGGGFKYSIWNFNFLLKIICIILCLIIQKINKDKLSGKELENYRFCNYLIVVSCFMNVASINFNMFTRFNLYFAIMLIIFIPNLFRKIPMKEKWLCSLAVYVGVTAIYIMDLVGNGELVPYVFLG